MNRSITEKAFDQAITVFAVFCGIILIYQMVFPPVPVKASNGSSGSKVLAYMAAIAVVLAVARAWAS